LFFLDSVLSVSRLLLVAVLQIAVTIAFIRIAHLKQILDAGAALNALTALAGVTMIGCRLARLPIPVTREISLHKGFGAVVAASILLDVMLLVSLSGNHVV